ncbi:MAG: hypothetical protein IJU81_01010 [Bacteroidales bacterium]|nr:hypothetical protein [Bacteroidales bacterium]
MLFFAAVLAALSLVALLFPRDGIPIGSANLRFPSLTSLLAPPEPKPNLDSIMAAEKLREERLAALNDSLHYYSALLLNGPDRFWFPNGDSTFFDPLFRMLDSARASGRVVRLLHYGDSQIEMDRMTASLRRAMQQLFGGAGPGLLPFVQTMYSPSVSQHASGALSLRICYGDSLELRANGNYGPMMRCYHLAGQAYCSAKVVDDSADSFSTVRLLVNNFGSPLTATLSLKASGFSQSQTLVDEGVQMLSWHLDSPASSMRLSLSGNADIYGLMLDANSGVAVDNIAMRGCSGQQFRMVNADQLGASYSLMDVGLIIMQFGGNSVPYLRNAKSLSSYCESIGKQIDYLHRLCPHATVLFVGPSDMSSTVGGVLQSYPFLPAIVDSLQLTATAHNAAYWSIFHAMGGLNSMLSWHDASLAGADYVHFTNKGANLMGDQLSQALTKAYNFYLFRRKMTPPPPPLPSTAHSTQ